MRVLLVGHACSPVRGSEPGNTWNFAWGLATAGVDVWLLSFPEFEREVDDFLARTPNPRLRIHYVGTSALDPWRKGRSPRLVKLHYLMWLRAAEAEARRLHAELGFDIVHHVSWTSVSAPPTLWRLDAPFVWGPVGGGQSTPAPFLAEFGTHGLAEVVRSWSLDLLPLSPALRGAARRSALVLSTNRETTRVLERAGARDVRPMLDSAVNPGMLAGSPRSARVDGTRLTLLYAGRLESRKGLFLALRTMSRLRHDGAHLRIAGDGPLLHSIEARARALGLDEHVTFLGSVPWKQMSAEFSSADAFLFPSIRDSFGSVVLEAMAHGLPVVTLDHQGVGSFLPDEAALKVPVTNPSSTAEHLASAVRTLVQDEEKRRTMAAAALEFAACHTWPVRIQRLLEHYREVIGHGSQPTP